MKRLQALTLSLQGNDKMVSELAQTIFSHQSKIKLFQRDINTKSSQHIPLLKGLVNSENDCMLRAWRVIQLILQQGFQI